MDEKPWKSRKGQLWRGYDVTLPLWLRRNEFTKSTQKSTKHYGVTPHPRLRRNTFEIQIHFGVGTKLIEDNTILSPEAITT
jgi:hypothetical protein